MNKSASKHLGHLIITAGLGLILAACSASSANKAGGGMGVTPDGSQDAGYFRATLRQGGIPEASDITLEGFISEHDIPSDMECDQTLCIEGHIGNDRAVAEGSKSGATFLHLAMGTNVDLESRPRMPVDLAVVVDVSGSMSDAGKMEYVKQGLTLMLDSLGANDRLALVTYSTNAQVVVESQLVGDATMFAQAIEALHPSGSTNLHGGMMLGYEQVAAHANGESLRRVMLLSDGLANVGVIDREMILADSKAYNDEGIGLTTIGVGMGFNQNLMRALAEQGGGNFYFVEDPEKVVTVFQDELDFLVTPLANDLRVTIRFGEGFGLVDVCGLAYEWDTEGNMTLQVPTVFASRRGGAMLIRVEAAGSIESLANAVVTDIRYGYKPIDAAGIEGPEEAYDAKVALPLIPTYASRVYDHPGVLKSIVVWNMVESFQAASNAYHLEYEGQSALQIIKDLAAYVDDANEELEDDEIAEDRRELINQFAINLGGYLGESGGHCDRGRCGDHGYYYGCTAAGGSTAPLAILCCLMALGVLVRRRRRNGSNGECLREIECPGCWESSEKATGRERSQQSA